MSAVESLAFEKRGVKMCTAENDTFCAKSPHACKHSAIELKVVWKMLDYLHCSAL